MQKKTVGTIKPGEFFFGKKYPAVFPIRGSPRNFGIPNFYEIPGNIVLDSREVETSVKCETLAGSDRG